MLISTFSINILTISLFIYTYIEKPKKKKKKISSNAKGYFNVADERALKVVCQSVKVNCNYSVFMIVLISYREIVIVNMKT